MDQNCIFCKIVGKEIPANRVYEDEKVLAFADVHPQAPVHYLIIPKEHVANVLEMEDEETMLQILSAIKALARQEGLTDRGFRVVNNCGTEGGQTVDHLHFHLLGGRNMQWPPG